MSSYIVDDVKVDRTALRYLPEYYKVFIFDLNTSHQVCHLLIEDIRVKNNHHNFQPLLIVKNVNK